MKNSSFIKDKTKFSDAEKIIHHVLFDEMVAFNKRSFTYIIILIISLVVVTIGIAIIGNQSGAATVIIILGLLGSIGSGLFFILNRIGLNINKIGLVYLPVSKMPFQNGSILIDRAGIIDNVKFEFNSLDTEDITIIDSIYDSLQLLTREMPLILSAEKKLDIPNTDTGYRKENLKIYTEELNLINLNNTLQEAFSRKKHYRIDLNAFKFSHGFYSYIQNLNAVPDTIIEEKTLSTVANDLNLINGVVNMYHESKESPIDIDDLSLQLLDLFNMILPRHDYSIHSSLNEIVVPLTYRQTNLIEMASYNYYCPVCNKVLIDNLLNGKYTHKGQNDSRVNIPANTMMKMVDLNHDLWKCPLCNHETNQPFPRHKMEDELFTPVYDKLYEENFVERLHIYNNINDQKRGYAEKAETQFHEVFRETRSKVDNIKSKIRTIGAEIDSDTSAIAYLTMVMTQYKMLEAQKSKEISADTAMYKKAIADESRKSRDSIDMAVAQARSEIDAAAEKYSSLEREDQSKRDSIQKGIAESMLNSSHANADTVRLMQGKKARYNY